MIPELAEINGQATRFRQIGWNGIDDNVIWALAAYRTQTIWSNGESTSFKAGNLHNTNM